MCKVIIPEGLRCVTQDEQDALLEKQWRARVELRAKQRSGCSLLPFDDPNFREWLAEQDDPDPQFAYGIYDSGWSDLYGQFLEDQFIGDKGPTYSYNDWACDVEAERHKPINSGDDYGAEGDK